MSKQIRITCTGADMVDVDALEHFQGELKTLSDKEYRKLRQSIARKGFSFPVFVWRDKAGRLKVIDGHQRLNTLREMLKDGYVLDGGRVPVAYIDAASEKDAKAKVLLAASQYGRYDEESVYRYIGEAGLDWGELKLEIDLPQISMGKLAAGYFKDDDVDETASTRKTVCPECGHEW